MGGQSFLSDHTSHTYLKFEIQTLQQGLSGHKVSVTGPIIQNNQVVPMKSPFE